MPPCHPRPRPRPALPLHSPQVAWRTCTVQYPQSSSSLCRVRVASHRRVPLPSSLQAVLCLPLDWATRQSGRRGRERERRNLLFVATGESAKRSTRPRRGSERPRPGCRGSSRTVGERSTLYVVCLRLVDVLILTRRLHYRQGIYDKNSRISNIKARATATSSYIRIVLSIFTFLSTGAGKSYQNKRVIVFQEEVIPGNGCSPIWAVEAMLFGIGNATLPRCHL